jgi:hypothetical protein
MSNPAITVDEWRWSKVYTGREGRQWRMIHENSSSGSTIFKKFPDFYGTLRFSAGLTNTCHWFILCTRRM